MDVDVNDVVAHYEAEIMRLHRQLAQAKAVLAATRRTLGAVIPQEVGEGGDGHPHGDVAENPEDRP